MEPLNQALAAFALRGAPLYAGRYGSGPAQVKEAVIKPTRSPSSPYCMCHWSGGTISAWFCPSA